MFFRAEKQVVRPMHTLTCADLLGKKPAISPPDFTANQGRQQLQTGLRAMFAAAPDLWEGRSPLPLDGFSFAVANHSVAGLGYPVMCVWEEETGRMVGGQWAVIPRLAHAFRGLKLGTEICLAAYKAGMIPAGMPLLYTVEGLAARRSAHREAVDRALAAGLEVPQRVLNERFSIAQAPEPAAQENVDTSLPSAKRLRAAPRKMAPSP